MRTYKIFVHRVCHPGDSCYTLRKNKIIKKKKNKMLCLKINKSRHMNSFKIKANQLPKNLSLIKKNIQQIQESKNGRIFIHVHSKAILELDKKTFEFKG